MPSYRFSDIAKVLSEKPLQQVSDPVIESLLTDSRKLLFPDHTLFFAISSTYRNASDFIRTLYEKQVRCFISDNLFDKKMLSQIPEANIIIVDNVLNALQKLVTYHRHRFSCPVIGVTGSNGKTMVKEWLYQLLSDEYIVAHSPKSYNSQVGVALSVWQMNEVHNMAIFEAGISLPGEMEKLQKMIDPGIGVITNIGEAHAEGFVSREEKIREKLRLFITSDTIIYGCDDELLESTVRAFCRELKSPPKLVTWSLYKQADLVVRLIEKQEEHSLVHCVYHDVSFSFRVPFTDDAHLFNAIICCIVLLTLDIPIHIVGGQMGILKPVEMRMELKQGIGNCSIINDSYSADLNSLSIAMDFLEQQQQHSKRTVILSDFLQSGLPDNVLYEKIASFLEQKKLHRFIGVGPNISLHAAKFNKIANRAFFSSTENLIEHLPVLNFDNETILLKGARVFRFERINQLLQHKLHETVLEINLNALRHNLKFYRKRLSNETRIMAMVKAFSYGSGSFEIANLLQHADTDYLAVAYADEGVELRKAGIHLPIMVMNAEEGGFASLLQYRLEPELYSFSIMNAFVKYIQQQDVTSYPVHIKLDTGMNRLGFTTAETGQLCDALKKASRLKVCSVFSHLASGEMPEHDSFTAMQEKKFLEASSAIRNALGYDFIRHIANSGAIHRLPHLQMDMVRLGIGLYGIDPDTGITKQLQNVSTLKTTISQIKHIRKGESVGYNRRGVVDKDSVIATVRIGYADGYPRILGNGKGKMLVNGIPAPVIGNICMDMCMLDISGIDASEGDEVLVFGEALPVNIIAGWAGTISYEILTGVSQRVRRVYYEE
jgi:Alr-MurF fusion protein